MTLQLPAPAKQCSHMGAIHPKRQMTGEKAAYLFAKLSPLLSVVNGYGYYPPDYGRHRKSTGETSGIRLCDRRCTSQNFVVWNPTEGRRLTFAEFLMVYNISIKEV